MGKWTGTAPLSRNGDWSHGALLHLKYNSHAPGHGAVPDGADTAKIGQAYSLALAMTQCALTLGGGTLADRIDDLARRHFGEHYRMDQIETTLRATRDGLRNTSGDNRIHLYTSGSKPGDASNLGYVQTHPLDAKGKQHLPQGRAYPRDATLDNWQVRRQGHVHINADHFGLRGWKEEAAWTMIHEMSHRFAGTGDFAYYSQQRGVYVRKGEIVTLTSDEQMHNADSYAAFCDSCYRARG